MKMKSNRKSKNDWPIIVGFSVLKLFIMKLVNNFFKLFCLKTLYWRLSSNKYNLQYKVFKQGDICARRERRRWVILIFNASYHDLFEVDKQEKSLKNIFL